MSLGEDTGRVPEPSTKQRKQRRSALGRVFASLVLLLIAAAVLAMAGGFYAYNEFTAEGPLPAGKVHIVEAGQSQQDIGASLEKEGIVSSGALFAGAAKINALRGQVLKPGEYEFPAGASMEQVMAIIAGGRAITYKITIPEGWTSEMAVARVNDNEVLAGEPVVAIPPEGSMRPDTYVFRRGMTKAKMVEDMQAAQTRLVAELWEEKPENFPLKTREEMVTLASIVEKETGVAEERQVVASVFLNRLKQGMRLQSDPTIIYGLVGGKGKLDRGLTRDDVASETPYNTYRIAGLPPGPIASPGRAALEAVLNPAATNYLYFVANGTGGHAFAETLAEHNDNVAKWRSLASGAAAVVATEAAPQASDATAANAVPPDVPQDPQAPAGVASVEAAPQVAPEAAPPPPSAAAIAPTQPADGAEAQPVPPAVATAPVEPAADANAAPATAAPEAPAPKPVAKPPLETAEAKPADAGEAPAPVAAKTVLQPGTVIKVANRLVPIPKQKPKK